MPTKIELAQHNARLAKENADLRLEVSTLKAQIAAMRATSTPINNNGPRSALFARARQLVQQGRRVVVRGDELIDYGPKEH